MSVRQLWAPTRQAEADDVRLVTFASRGSRQKGRKDVDIEADVEEVVDGDADGNHQGLPDLLQSHASVHELKAGNVMYRTPLHRSRLREY